MDIIGRVAHLNNQGIVFEKGGEIDRAIQCYENNIKLCWPATHSYDRLTVIYDRQKRYNDEIRVIKIAIDVFSNERVRRQKNGVFAGDIEQLIQKYEKRLSKTLIKENG